MKNLKVFFLKALLIVMPSFLLSSQTYAQENYKGLFNFQYENSTGKILLDIENLDQEFIFVNALGTGLGSNDIGLDRGKLVDTKIVKWQKHGDRILLVQPNQGYRAYSDNKLEKQSVSEAFAFSVIYGTKIEKTNGNKYTIDITPLLLEDVNLVANVLKESKQGAYKLDKSRSALYFENIHAFPDNVEFESILTFMGDATGAYIKQVTPSPELVSYRQHISFIRLPDDKYKPREFHPESGYFNISYYDYASPIDEPIEKRFITRHRLEKRNPYAAVSDPIEPVTYYIDPGCPEPIKSALVEGGRWWANAFEAAGFSNAFFVKELPVDAHPLDVRYNMIQWVHRSTRGWSYGSSIADPRTGEIIKGHVSLGSLRVRQDYMIAQGILSAFKQGSSDTKPMVDMALARLRQLSAHEIGHTIGLSHNFAASVDGRASVMDYPHPYITKNIDGSIDFSKAYDDKIGIWDKRAIIYGYSDVKSDDTSGLVDIIKLNNELGLHYLTDEDARSVGSASPITHLWDNGTDPVTELKRLLELRKFCIQKFGPDNIPDGSPLSELDKVFVPLYYMHRYQTEAVSKLIGGLEYSYATKGLPKLSPMKAVDSKKQDEALSQMLSMLSTETLSIPSSVSQWIMPPAQGYNRNSESFPTNTSPAFDPQAIYESATSQIIELLTHPDRLSRLYNQQRLSKYLESIRSYFSSNRKDKITNIGEKQFVLKLKQLSLNESLSVSVKSEIAFELNNYLLSLIKVTNDSHTAYLKNVIESKEVKAPLVQSIIKMPPGQPIGCTLE